MATENEKWQEKPAEGASSADREGNVYRRAYNGGEESEQPRRAYEGGERPYRSYRNEGGYGSDRPRRPYNNDGFNNDRPRRSYDNEGGFNSERPRRSYNNEGGFNSERPRRSYNSEGGYNSERPRRSFDGEGERPRRPRFPYAQEPSKDGAVRPDGRPRRPRIQKAGENTEWLAENNFKTPKYAPNLDPSKPIRLNKFLSNAGVCSRREADEFIQAGVVKVNGETVSELGVKVMPTDEIMFHDQPVKIERKVYILLNKPKDCVTTSEDPQERLTVMDIVKNACYERIYPVGRLDRNTTGVLLLTNDGDLASKLAHPKYDKRKIYQVTLDRDVTEEDKQSIAQGVELEGEMIAVDDISYVSDDKHNTLGIEIHSGQNRVVRRIFEKFGYHVYKLDRVYFAGLTKKNLPRGKWRHLTEQEVNLLKMGVFA